MTLSVYVLECENNKYYVGQSYNVQRRYQQHLEGKGSAWTRKNKPKRILSIHPNVDAFYEDMRVKQIMSLYGIDNVRGGSYVKIKLSSVQTTALQIELLNAANLCVRCHKPDHYVTNCNEKFTAEGLPILDFGFSFVDILPESIGPVANNIGNMIIGILMLTIVIKVLNRM